MAVILSPLRHISPKSQDLAFALPFRFAQSMQTQDRERSGTRGCQGLRMRQDVLRLCLLAYWCIFCMGLCSHTASTYVWMDVGMSVCMHG